VKVSGQKLLHVKVCAPTRGPSTTAPKTFPVKGPHGTQVSKSGVGTGTGVPPRAVAPSGTMVSKTTVIVAATVTASRAGVLKISIGVNRPVAVLSLMANGEQVKVDVRPPPASVTPQDVFVRQPVMARSDADWVVLCTIFDSVPSMESCSSPSNFSPGSESVVALPPLVPDVDVSMELLHMIEVPVVEAAGQEVPVNAETHAASPEGWFS
jgi:hypothetical protein